MEPILDPELRDLEEALMSAGREVNMSPQLRMKTLTALGIGGAAAAAVVTTKFGTWGWWSTKAGTAWTAGMVGSLGIVGAVMLLNSNSAPTQNTHDTSQVTRVEARASTSTAEAPLPPAGTPPVQLADLPIEPEQTSSSAAEGSTQQQLPSGGQPQSSASRLREELSHLSKVETALRAGRPDEALSLLQEYPARFPKSQLGLEAEVLTIQAMYEGGSIAAAQTRARRFLDRHPNSPLGARAKQYLRE